MSDKDEFTFDDNDDFPETDLSSAFEDGEQQAPEPPEPEPPAKGGRSSRSRVLLLVLLLVIACGAGAYYFMGLGGTTPEPAKPKPAQPAKTVALPPKPATPPPSGPTPVEPEPAPQQEQAATATPPAEPPAEKSVAPPPPKPAAEAVAQAESTAAPATAEAPTAAKPSASEPTAEVEAKAPEKGGDTAVAAAPATPEPEAVPPPSPVPAKELASTGGAYVLDAGAYLLAENRDRLVAKLRELGYEPQVTPVEATVTMTRLRLGTFPEGEAEEALGYVQKIEPGAFSVREGEQYVLYAGTFFSQENVRQLKERLEREGGIVGEPVPVDVISTLSRIRFGNFATAEEAAAAAERLSEAGVEARVVAAD